MDHLGLGKVQAAHETFWTCRVIIENLQKLCCLQNVVFITYCYCSGSLLPFLLPSLSSGFPDEEDSVFYIDGSFIDGSLDGYCCVRSVGYVLSMFLRFHLFFS